MAIRKQYNQCKCSVDSEKENKEEHGKRKTAVIQCQGPAKEIAIASWGAMRVRVGRVNAACWVLMTTVRAWNSKKCSGRARYMGYLR